MYRHPFARATSPAIGDYSQKADISKRRLMEAYPASGRVLPSAHIPTIGAEPGVKVQCEQDQRRPGHKSVIQDAGVTLTLNGQEQGATIPEYRNGAVVDGAVGFSNPSNITKVEVKIEGHVMVKELGGFDSSSVTPVLSELLVLWDAPNRLGGYGNSPASGAFAPQPGLCPHVFSFRASLPTEYTEADGSTCALPPSFADTLPGVPGFRCAVQYFISVYLTRVRDVRVKTIRAQWKRNSVLRIPVEYRPRTRPSQPGPFPANSTDPSLGPITRFSVTLESQGSFAEPIKATLYLPHSQVTSFSSPIPFFLRVSGPGATIDAYSRPPLSSFLPKAGPDSFPTICSLIGHVVNENLQNSRLGKALAFSNTRSDSWSPLGGDEKDSDGWAGEEKSRRRMRGAEGAQPSNGIRVMLVREVFVRTRLHPYPRQYGNLTHVQSQSHPPESELEEPVNEFDVFLQAPPNSGSDTSSFVNPDGTGGGKSGGHMHKRTLLGEGIMYTASMSRGRSITWAGEIRVDPRLRVRTGGFATRSLVVKDMLIVSLRDPHPHPGGRHREFQQIIPIQLTTDSFKEEF